MNRKIDLWLVLYGIFVALLIQAIYDGAGSYFSGSWNLGSWVKLIIGLGAPALALPLLVIYFPKAEKDDSQYTKPKENVPENRGLLRVVLIFLLIAIIIILVILNFLNYPLLETPNILNIILTSALVFFASIEAYSTVTKARIEKKRRQSIYLRNELEKVYGPIYSVLNNVVYAEERKAIFTQSEKKMMDETFSQEPFTLTSQKEWKLKFKNQETNDIYVEFIEEFNKEYESKKAKETIEKQFSPIYSMFKNVYQNVRIIGILLPNEKTMIDKKFSTYPFMLNQELYDLWNKEIRPLELTIGWKAFEYRLTICENLRINQNEVPNMQGYLIPKAFILKSLEAYQTKVYEYRKM